MIGWIVRFSRALEEHRLAAFLITAVVLVLVADSIRRVLPDESRTNNVLTLVLVAVTAYSMWVLVYIPKRLPPDRRTFITWQLGLTPAIFGFAAVLYGSLSFVMWIGVLLSLGLVGFGLARSRAS